MISWHRAACAVMSICAAAGTAGAQTVETDVRCVTVSKFFANIEKDPAKKQLAFASAFFFLGRIDARLSPDQLKTQIALPGATIKKTEAGELMTFCAKKLKSSEQSLMNMGHAPPSPFPKK